MLEAKKSVKLLKGSRKGGTARVVTDKDSLYNNKDLLGKVTIYFNRKKVSEFPDYEAFWEAVKR